MTMVQSEFGVITLFEDFMGPEIPVAGTSAYAAAASDGHMIGQFRVVGDLAETDTGIVGLSKSGGYARISGNDEDGKGVAVCTEVNMSPALNGTIVVEARVEMQALTTRSVFIGLCATIADDVAEPITSTGTTMTMVASHLAGFLFDSQLTAGTRWHMPYLGGATTGPTLSTTVQSDVIAVAGESDILRLEVDPDGKARWYINGVLKQTVTGAVSTTTLQGALLGCFGTTTTAADIDADYFYVRCNRDWTR